MPLTKLALIPALATCLLGCSGLVPIEAPPRATAETVTSVRAPIGGVTVALPNWQVPPKAGITVAEQEYLTTLLQASLVSSLTSFDAGRRSLVVEATITRVDTVSPSLNVASSLLLFLPLDRGGATVEIICKDTATDTVIATYISDHDSPLSQMRARFKRLGPAELALRKSAYDMRDVLQKNSKARQDAESQLDANRAP